MKRAPADKAGALFVSILFRRGLPFPIYLMLRFQYERQEQVAVPAHRLQETSYRYER